MRSEQEKTDPNSCANRARPGEMVFTLLGRDPAAPYAIRAWATERVMQGKNKWTDPQIMEAMQAAVIMERERKEGAAK